LKQSLLAAIPKCGTRKKIELDPTTGELGGNFDPANELNMKEPLTAIL